MKKTYYLLLLLLSGLFANSQDLVITNVNVIPVEGGPMTLPNMTVFIKGGKITDIMPFRAEHDSLKMQKVNGKGKYLIPGLVDAHVHLPSGNDGISLNKFFTLSLASGVTSLRSMRGEPRHPGLRDSINKKLILAPDLYISNSLPSDSTTTAKDLKKFVAQCKKQNWDFVKYLSGLSPALFDSAVKYCDQNKIKLAGHVYNGNLQTAIKAKQASVEHYQSILKEYNKDTAQFNNVITQLKENNIFVCPTLSFYNVFGLQFSPEQLKARNGMAYMSKELQEKWMKNYTEYYNSFNDSTKKDVQKNTAIKVAGNLNSFGKLLKQMSDKNVILLLSPDDGDFNVPGFAMYEEMKLYKNAGLSNYAILKSATYNGACFFNKQKEWGSVTRNKKANLVLLDKNPLEDIENIKAVNGVILDGKFFTQAQLLNK